MKEKTAKALMAISLVIAIALTIAFGAWITVRIVKAVQFDLNCSEYISRAVKANNVETAKKELAKAIDYAEENDLTEGITHIVLYRPRNDVGRWYNNMKEAYEKLEVAEKGTLLEQTNLLMEIRDSGISSPPEGISIYPQNVLYFWWGLLSFILAIVMYIVSHNFYWRY